MLGLGQKAVYLPDSKVKAFRCFIPAGKGHNSNCVQDVYVPHGLINFLQKNKINLGVRLTLGRSQDLCVPNAECKTGYKYVGIRCACKRGYQLNPVNGTCSHAVRISMKVGSNNWGIFANFLIVSLGWVYLNKYFHFSIDKAIQY